MWTYNPGIISFCRQAGGSLHCLAPSSVADVIRSRGHAFWSTLIMCGYLLVLQLTAIVSLISPRGKKNKKIRGVRMNLPSSFRHPQERRCLVFLYFYRKAIRNLGGIDVERK